MYTCSLENEYGEKLSLTNNPNYTVYRIDGLEPPTAVINTSPVANFDGSRFNSSKVNERNIVIYLTIENDCEANRINLYKHVKTKRFVKFYYKNSSREVYAVGYVESISIGIFEQKQSAQISILCPYSYFKNVNACITDFSTLEPMFVFPFAYDTSGAPFSVIEPGQTHSIVNGGDIENGVVITVKAVGRALNPTIFNLSKNEYFKINVDMFAGDEVVINTNKGSKKVTLTHDGVTTNVINAIERGSTWFELLVGDNLFTYDADEFPSNLLCTLTHENEFEGV